MTPEFARPLRIDQIGEGERVIDIEADIDERRRIAGRFGLIAVDRLLATFAVRREAAGVIATGTVTASVTQACSATGQPIEASVDEQVSLRFVDDVTETDGEIELSDDALDTLPIENGAIDLGEAAAETMALALDPFPRAPGTDETLRAAGVIGEEEVRPFSAFAALKKQLDG